MTPTEHALIQASYDRLRPRLLPLVEHFYADLFTRDPALRAYVPADLRRQTFKFLDTLAVVVSHLDRPGRNTPMLHALGASHAGYGATPATYATVEAALLATLAAALGSGWTPDVAAAWTTLYREIATAMQAGGGSH